MCLLRAWIASALLGAAGLASASPAVILVENRVAQYRAAADAAKTHLPDAVVVEPGNVNSADLQSAPVIVAVGNKALAVAREKAPTTPTVFCMLLSVSPAQLNSYVTGVPLETDPAVAFSQFRSLDVSLKRLGVIFNPQASELVMAEATKAAAKLGLTLVAKSVSNSNEFKDVLASLSGQVDGLWLPPDPKLFNRELFIFLLSFSAERKLPVFGFLQSFTQAGALASVSADFVDIGNRAGKLAAEISARPEGKRIPVPGLTFSPGELSVNTKTAIALGVELSPSALQRAKEVIR